MVKTKNEILKQVSMLILSAIIGGFISQVFIKYSEARKVATIKVEYLRAITNEIKHNQPKVSSLITIASEKCAILNKLLIQNTVVLSKVLHAQMKSNRRILVPQITSHGQQLLHKGEFDQASDIMDLISKIEVMYDNQEIVKEEVNTYHKEIFEQIDSDKTVSKNTIKEIIIKYEAIEKILNDIKISYYATLGDIDKETK